MTQILKNITYSTVAIVTVVAFTFAPVAATPQDRINHGLRYLQNNQLESGEIDPASGFSKPSQWGAIAFAANDIDPDTVQKTDGASLEDHLSNTSPGQNATAIDWASKILAIRALDGEPTSFGVNNINYVDKLESFHSGTKTEPETDDQLGNPCQVNDDIFGLMALVANNNSTSTEIKQDALNFIIAQQDDSGGFSYAAQDCEFYFVSSDMTGAGLYALVKAEQADLHHEGLTNAIEEAKQYLLNKQNTQNGGFGNADTTAWALNGLYAVNADNQVTNSAEAYLLQSQDLGDPCSESFGSFSGFSGPDTTTSAHSLIALSGQGWIVEPADEGSKLAKQTFNCETPQPLPGSGSGKKQTDQTSTNQNSGSQDTGEVSGISTASIPTNTGQYITQLPGETTEESQSQSDSDETERQTDQPVDSSPAQVQSETQATDNNYVWYGLIVLSIGAIGWYLLQTLTQRSKI